MHPWRSIRAVSVAGLFVIVAACGGGGGGGSSDAPNPPSSSPPGSSQPPPDTTPPGTSPPGSQPPPDTQLPPDSTPPPATVSGTVTYQSTDLTFATALRNATPAEQTIPFTIAGAPAGQPFFKVTLNGRTMQAVNVTFTDGGGTVRFRPASASRLSPGTNTDQVTIALCLDDSTCQSKVIGQPQTFNVTYTVTSAVQGTTLTPRVAAANRTGTVVLRGAGFRNASSVRFGTTLASNVTVVSDTEIRASYPALAPGRYAVSIDGGAVTFNGALTTVAIPSYATALVPFTTTPYQVADALYDPERNAVLVVTQAEQPENNQLVKFAYNGTTWSLASATTVPNLQDVAFSPDGSVLFAATSSQLIELNPTTLVPGTSYRPPGTANIQSVALANDGYLIVTTVDTVPSQIYLYSTRDHTFAAPEARAIAAIAGNSPSGSFVGLVQGANERTGLPLDVPQYDASAQLFSNLSGMPPSDGGIPSLRAARPALDFFGSLMVLNTTRFVGNDFSTFAIAFRTDQLRPVGQLPAFVHGLAVKADGSRVYTVKSQFGIGAETAELRTYDVAQFSQIGNPISLNVPIGDTILQMTQTPDSSTLFVVGDFGLKIQPLPN